MNYKCFFFEHRNSIISSKKDKEIHVYGCSRCLLEYEDETAKFKMVLEDTGRSWIRTDIRQNVYVVSFGSWVNNGIVDVYYTKEEAEKRVKQLEDSDIQERESYEITKHEVLVK